MPLTSISMFELYSRDPSLEGAWFASYSTPTPIARKWYEDIFHKNVPLGMATYCDWTDLIYKGFEGSKTGKKLTSEQFAEFLRGVRDFPGASGPITMNAHGVFETPPSLEVIKNGVPVPLDK